MGEAEMTLKEAVAILGLPERASFVEVRKRYKELLLEWHPDHCTGEREACKAMAGRIIDAFQVVEPYCLQYPIPFGEEALASGESVRSEDAFWSKHFGEDPIWG